MAAGICSLREKGEKGAVHPIPNVPYLEKAGSERKKQSDQEKEEQHDRPPDESVQTGIYISYKCKQLLHKNRLPVQYMNPGGRKDVNKKISKREDAR